MLNIVVAVTLFCRSGTFKGSKGKGDDDGGRRYVRVTHINGIGGYDHGGYDNRGYDHGGYGGRGRGGYGTIYSGDYGHSSYAPSYAPSYGSKGHGPVSHHYTDIIIEDDSKGKGKGDKGHKGFFKGLKGLGKGFHKGVDHLVKKGKGFVGLDDKYEFVGVLRPKKYGGYGDDHYGGGGYYDDGYAPIY